GGRGRGGGPAEGAGGRAAHVREGGYQLPRAGHGPRTAGVSTSPSGEQFEIAAGDQRAVVVEVGGGLRSYSAGGREVLDGYGDDEMCTSGRGQVLAPWPNRLDDGSYEFAGTRHQLPLTEPEHGNAIH